MKYLFSLFTSLVLLQGTLSAETWKNLVPKPANLTPQTGNILLEKGFKTYLTAPQFEDEMLWLQEKGWEKLFVFPIQPAQKVLSRQDLNQAGVYFLHDASLGAEAYRLEITPTQIRLTASEDAGMFYAVQTLLQMLPAQVFGTSDLELREYALDCVTIEDQPRYGYRGLMLDVSRTFYNASQVKEIIGWMAAHK